MISPAPIGLLANLFGFVLMFTPLREVLDLTRPDSTSKKQINHIVYIAQFGNYAIWSLFGCDFSFSTASLFLYAPLLYFLSNYM